MPAQQAAYETGHELSAQATRLVEDHVDLASRLAGRYFGRGEPMEDLRQVAMLGLVLAARRFDPERGTSFAAYATPTILGEVRRHFRDRCWAVRVPRPVHDLYRASLTAWERLSTSLQREPTMPELAGELGVDPKELSEALNGGSAYSTMSLDLAGHDNGDEPGRDLTEIVGDDDQDLFTAEQREAVRRVLPRIPPRERRMLALWFYGNRTQSQIAAELEVSQMHVSRLLESTLERLRTAIEEDLAESLTFPKPRRRQRTAA